MEIALIIKAAAIQELWFLLQPESLYYKFLQKPRSLHIDLQSDLYVFMVEHLSQDK